MSAASTYTPPLSLTILSAIFIGAFALCALWIALDIIYRQGWKSMMAVMYTAVSTSATICVANHHVLNLAGFQSIFSTLSI